MRVGIVGVGGIGGALVAALAKAGPACITTSAVARGEAVLRLRSFGLRVVGDDSEYVVRGFKLYDDIANLPLQNYIFLCTKAWANAGIVRALAESVNAKTTLVPLQNGRDPAANLRLLGHRGSVVDAAVWAASHLVAPATVEILAWPKILVWCDDAQVRGELTSLFRASHVGLSVVDSPLDKARWLKFGFVLALSTATTLRPGPCVSVLEDLSTREIFFGLATEFAVLSVERGLVEDPCEFITYCEDLLRSMPRKNVASMAADVWAGRPGELASFLDELLALASHMNQFATARARLRAEHGV